MVEATPASALGDGEPTEKWSTAAGATDTPKPAPFVSGVGDVSSLSVTAGDPDLYSRITPFDPDDTDATPFAKSIFVADPNACAVPPSSLTVGACPDGDGADPAKVNECGPV
jgi:hypothetical protein